MSRRSSHASAVFEPLEERRLLSAVLRPDHIVVVIEQDRSTDAIGGAMWDYLNGVARQGLIYTNFHGVSHPTQPNLLALYSGSTQGVTSNGQGYFFDTEDNLARSLFDGGFSFGGYVEDLPFDGAQVHLHGDATHSDLYTRYSNPMAMFGNIGIDPNTGLPRDNAAVNRTFNAFASIPTNDYSSLPSVSFVIPNNLNSTHGSNFGEPWAGSSDEDSNDYLRDRADGWLQNNIDSYLQWAKNNNSLLIVVSDEERWTGGTSEAVTMIVAGDTDLFTPGVNNTRYDHFNLVRTITDMYGLSPLGDTGATPALATDAQGRLAPTAAGLATVTSLTQSSASTAIGQAFTLTATVASNSPSKALGLVTFKAGNTVLGTAMIGWDGRATLSVDSLGVGSHPITAVYNGSPSHLAGTSAAVMHTVSRTAATITLVAAPSPSTLGQGVRFTATLAGSAGAATPTGTVQFRVDGNNFGSPVPIVDGVALSPAINSMWIGNHTITAVYSGDAHYTPVTSPNVTHRVNLINNNFFLTRYAISGSSLLVTGSNAGASKETGEPNHGGKPGGRSVWWTWTAPVSGYVSLDTAGSTFDTTLGVYTGTAVNALSTIASNDDSPLGGTLSSRVNFPVTAGQAYQIAVDGYEGEYGDIMLRLNLSNQPPAQAPANNDLANAAPIPSSGGTVTGTNFAATRQPGEQWHVGNVGGRSVWWTWTAPRSGLVTVDTMGSDFDTLLGIYTGTTPPSLVEIVANDDSALGNTYTSRATFNAVAGATYKIAVDGWGGETGNITLKLTQA